MQLFEGLSVYIIMMIIIVVITVIVTILIIFIIADVRGCPPMSADGG